MSSYQTGVSPPITVPSVRERKHSSKKIVALTAYDYTTALLLDREDVDIILVGDSVASIVQGESNTLPVTLDDMVYHCRAVSKGVKRALVVGDLPFLSYQISPEDAIRSAGRLLKEGRVGAVKLEGGMAVADTIKRIVAVDIPVMGHVGLTPQSYHRMGGHKIQGRSHGDENGSWERILEDALQVEASGAFAIVIEGVPADLATEITKRVTIPTIGIGAGSQCDGQILVTHDMLGLGITDPPRFVKKYLQLSDQIGEAVRNYAEEVRSGAFPSAEHTLTNLPIKQLKRA